MRFELRSPSLLLLLVFSSNRPSRFEKVVLPRDLGSLKLGSGTSKQLGIEETPLSAFRAALATAGAAAARWTVHRF